MSDLFVWLYGARVARIERLRTGKLRLEYADEARRLYELGSPLLSVSLPLVTRSFPNGVTTAFLEGLLPEGAPRNEIAADLDLVASDTYGLISALGRDCAGALVIQPGSDPDPPAPTTATAERLTDNQVDELIANLRSAPLGTDSRVRVSLAGVQEKLLLTRMPDGSWGRPVDGTPSTHIIKPGITRFPHTVANEAFCMRLAGYLGLSAARVDVMTTDSTEALVIERYDRRVDPDGNVERLHQEDLCQALGVPPKRKYEEDGGPSLAAIARVLADNARTGSLEDLLRAVTVNVLVGNGDAHGKNYSLMHRTDGALELAPLYDLMCTSVYGDDHLAMRIDGLELIERVTGGRLVNEAVGWGLARKRAAEIVSGLLEGAPSAIESAHAETGGVPDGILVVVERRLRALGEGLTD